MVAKIGNEKFCRVFDWNINEQFEGWAFCTIKTEEETEIDAFNGLAMDLYARVQEVIPVSAVATPPDGYKI